MTSEKKPEDGASAETAATEAAPQAGQNEGVQAQAQPAEGAGEAGQPAAIAELARLRAEAGELKDRLLRAHAEMDNVRKRLEREKADASKFAISKFARDVVGIGDNVQRAIDAVPHRLAEQDPALKSFVEGVTMIERELLSVLGRHGIKRLDPKGEPFNPHQHQAVVEVPSADMPAGTVTQVFQAGYLIEERVLRPAMVAVSKGGPKAQPPAEAVTSPSADGTSEPRASGEHGSTS
ncbi:MAG: nucleotide exchange factor GrpE [Hyphomicrobiaceae bacterium]